jgi:hypothetical protein
MNKTNEHVPQESFYASDNPQNTIEDTVTPPTSPQHPSPPPAPFSAAVLYQQSMRQEIYQLQIQLKELEMIVTEPFVIYCEGRLKACSKCDEFFFSSLQSPYTAAFAYFTYEPTSPSIRASPPPSV